MLKRSLFLAAVMAALIAPAPSGATVVDTRLSYTADDDTGMHAIDQSPNGNDGRMHGGLTRVHGVYKFHRLSRDNKFDRIIAPNSPSLNPGTGAFTYSVRLKVSPNAEWSHTEMAVLRHGDSDEPGGDYKLELVKLPTGRVAAFCVIHDDDGSGAGFVQGRGGMKTIADDKWHTVACSRVDADTVSLRVDDNVVEKPVRGDLNNVEGDVPLMVGCQFAANGPKLREQFVGKMDNISITLP